MQWEMDLDWSRPNAARPSTGWTKLRPERVSLATKAGDAAMPDPDQGPHCILCISSPYNVYEVYRLLLARQDEVILSYGKWKFCRLQETWTPSFLLVSNGYHQFQPIGYYHSLGRCIRSVHMSFVIPWWSCSWSRSWFASGICDAASFSL